MGNTAPKWFGWVAIALVLWNAFGVYMFASAAMMTPAQMAALPQDQQTLWAQMPQWGWAGFAIGTIGGLLAAIGLVLKKKWAMPLALLSVFGVIANFLPAFALSHGVDVWQAQYMMGPIFIFAVALFQLWLARKANASGWTS